MNIWVPQQFNQEERKILETLRESTNFKPDQKDLSDRKGLFDKMKDFFGG